MTTPAAAATRSIENFREWLKHEIAKSADVGYTRLDMSMALEDVGISSVHVVRIAGEIEKLLGIELEATALYEFATLDEMCATLLRMHAGREARGAGAEAARLPVNIAATFTAEPIEESIRHLLSRLGFDPKVSFARYNQVFQELLSPNGLLASARGGVNIVLARVEDWFRYGDAPSLEQVDRTVDDFLSGLHELTGRTDAPVLLGLCPHSPGAVRRLGLAETLDALDRRILDAAGRVPGVHVVDLRHVEAHYRVGRVWDEARDRLGHIPYTQAAYTAMGALVARRAAALLVEPAKVIVLDCDNTLWAGVTGEDGPHGVRPFVELQRFLVEQASQGKLLCLCSKNNEADVWRTFDAHPDMPLQREHLVAWRLNWQPKSENVRSLAKALGLGLDSFVFVDDNPMECAEVAEALPEVLAVQVPEPARIPAWISHHWAFDTARVTDEDRKRTRMYRENRERTEMRAGAASFEDFLARLELVVDVAELADDEVERAAQLTHRTNQFNADKRVRTEGEIEAMRREPGRGLWRVRVRDRFGDYGFAGMMSVVSDADTLVCDTFLMSCRVLGRRVEHAMVRRIGEEARRRGAREVSLRFAKAERNQPVREFYESLGRGILPTAEDRGEVRMAPDEIEGWLGRAVEVCVPEEAAPGAPASSRRADARAGFDEIARAGADLDAIQAAIDATTRVHRPALATEYVTPRTSWEKNIAAIWRDVLRIDRVGVYDSFFELGGDSIRAAEAFARMWDLGVPEAISLQTVPDPSVAGLCRAIEDVKAGRTPTLLADRFSLEAEGLLAEDIRNEGYDVSTYDHPIEVVFLTGGTGYIGAFLIHELMLQTEARVLCLVRAATPEDGLDRIVANLRRYDLWRPEHASRVEVVLGDLLEPRFGLSEAGFRALAERIDTIFHSAAWVNFVYPYQHLKPTNVDSTETVLRLAVAARPKPIQVQFVSTLGVIMSTGYGRDNLVYEKDPLLFADDLLNGYEQTKYASDKMVWTAMKLRGIPAAIYRPGMVGGLSDGTYHKLDEFLPQFLKGCIQLGAWPAVDTTWEVAPIDFVSKAIVHVARKPRNLNKAYFVLHPDSRRVSDWIEWHRDFGYEVRGLPWDVWKRELLNLGTERLRKNALFPFVDFVRALSEEQVYFPPTDRAQFSEAIADLDFRPPPQLELLERYTRSFIDCLYYDNLPSGPRSRRVNERAPVRDLAKTRGDVVDERVRYRGDEVNFGEAYYVLWNDPEKRRSMVVRYVLHDGPIEEARVAEVWCWFRDRENPRNDVAVRQRYPIGRAEVLDTDDVRLRIGPSGYGKDRVWGEVHSPDGSVRWDLALDMRDAFGVERISGVDAYDIFPHFQSNGVRHRLSGTVVVNGDTYQLKDQLASDGHYWNTKHLKSWAWAHCARFDNDPDFVFEGIGTRFNDWSQTSTWLTFLWKGEVVRSNLVDALFYNRETDATLTSWSFVAERGDIRFVGKLVAKPEDQILIIHPLPDDEYLYTHISYNADIVVDVERKEGGRWWRTETRTGTQTASFEVTRKVRNPDVRREFRIVRAR